MSTASKSRSLTIQLDPTIVREATKTYVFSKRYIKTAVVAVGMNVFYNRFDEDESYFVKKSFEGIPYVVFNSKQTSEQIKQYSTWITSFQDAYEKDFLKEVRLYMVKDGTEDIVESYRLKFANVDRTLIKPDPKKNLIEPTKNLLQSLHLLSTYPKLEQDVGFRVEFIYRDEVPDVYDAPNFKRLDYKNSFNYKLDLEKSKGVSDCLVLSNINTGYHVFLTYFRGNKFKDQTLSPKAITDVAEKEDPPNQSRAGKKRKYNLSINKDDAKISSETFLEDSANKANDSLNASKDNFETAQEDNIVAKKVRQDKINTSLNGTLDENLFDSVGLDDPKFRCFCQNKHSFDVDLETISCSKCRCAYHVVCHGFMKRSHIINTFSCVFCHFSPNDKIILRYSHDRFPELSTIRLVVYHMIKTRTFLPPALDAEDLELLKSVNIIENVDNNGWKSSPSILLESVKKYFNKPEFDSQVLEGGDLLEDITKEQDWEMAAESMML